MKKSLVFAASSLMVLASPAMAGTVVSGFTTTTLTRCDDCASGAQALGFSANFFGTSYTNSFVSNNGYITFNSGQGTFTPTGLGAGYSGQPIIAAFFADVDTRPALGGFTQYGQGSYAGRNAFGVTWTDVGYFSQQTNRTNTFQIILTDRSDTGAGNFDIYFNYDRILWETGGASGGANGFGGTSAAAGYNAGTGAAGTFGQLTGSLVNGAFLNGGANALVTNTNNGTPGQFQFNVRNGTVAPPTGAVPEPATWLTMIAGFGLLGASMRRRQKVCVRFAM